VEYDDLIHTVQELGSEEPSEFMHQLALHLLIPALAPLLLLRGRESEGRVARDIFAAHVRGEDDNRVAKIHLASLGIGQLALLHDLEEHVECLRVSLFDLVKTDHAVGSTPHSLRQLPGLFISHITRGSAHQPRDGVPFHELGHIELQQRVFAAEHELGQCLGQFGFSDTRGAQEDKRADRPPRVLEPCSGAAHGTRQRANGLVLPNNALVECVLHPEQP